MRTGQKVCKTKLEYRKKCITTQWCHKPDAMLWQAKLLKNESSKSPAISFAIRANRFLPHILTILQH